MGKIKALYHDNDPFKCAVVREAIKAGAITDGEVICGDIKELRASDLVGFARCHFFCGGGFWDLALNLAGWGDREVWTGSCPCPSYSSAGKGGGFDDPRHLWPDWEKLIRVRHPATIFGEQVAAAIGHGWLDLVCGDLEEEGYAVAAAVLGAHSAGAPHIRQRLYFCAHAAHSDRRSGERGTQAGTWPDGERRRGFAGDSTTGILPHADGGLPGDGEVQRGGQHGLFAPDRGTGEDVREWRGPGWLDPLTARSVAEAGATRGFWADCDWWYGRDGKYRPIGPGLQPLAHGSPARVGRLRMFGDAICIETAKVFIEAYIDTLG